MSSLSFSSRGARLLLPFCTALFLYAPCHASDVRIHSVRQVDTIGRGGPSGPDTFGVTIRFFSSGRFDTLWKHDTIFDTTRLPIDVVLSFDLSTSMAGSDAAIDPLKRPRVVWTKCAALGFLDSLKPGDRVAIMGWTSAGSPPPGLADTANTARYFRKWSPFFSNFDSARTFIRDSLFIDSTVRIVDTCEGQKIVVRDNIPGGAFSTTPLRISSFLAARRLAEQGRRSAKRAVIMLTDGQNNDGIPLSVPVAAIDTLFHSQGQQFHTIGIISGDTTELRSLAAAGGGAFCNAAVPGDLASVFAKLARLLISSTIDTSYSTVPVIVRPDTVRGPVDVLLALDMSGSMIATDSTPHTRFAWIKMASLDFIDSLKPSDRVAVLGTTSSGPFSVPADTAYPSRFLQRWLPFTADLDMVRGFIYDSLCIDDSVTVTDTFRNRAMAIAEPVPGGTFGDTPLRVAAMLASSRLSTYARPLASKAVIMLTDGLAHDDISRKTVVQFIDSLRRTQAIQFNAIGFLEGDTTELRALAAAGRGSSYNAKNSTELQTAYAALSKTIVMHVAARNLVIQEVLSTPPLYYVNGSQRTTARSDVPADSVRMSRDVNSNTVLRWYFGLLRVWDTAEVYYAATEAWGRRAAIGVDSAHAGGGAFSSMIFANDSADKICMPLPRTGGDDETAALRRESEASPYRLSFRNTAVSLTVPARETVTFLLYNLSGRLICRAAVAPAPAVRSVVFRFPAGTPSGIYALSMTAGTWCTQRHIALLQR